MSKIVTEIHHNLPTSAHLGRTRTYHNLLKGYFWPKIYQDTKDYVQSCKECQLHKTNAPNPFNRSLNPSLPEGPNCRISIDLIGPLPLTEKNHRYVLVMVDYYTKWAEAVPLTSKTGEEVADAIYKYWYCVYGIPYELQTKLGKVFLSTS